MNQEEKREYKRQWREKHKNDPDYKEKRKKEAARYYAKNKDKIRERERKLRAENEEYRQKCAAENKRWKTGILSDPEKKAEFNIKSRNYQRRIYASESAKKEKALKEKGWYHNRQTEATRENRRVKRRAKSRERVSLLVEMLGGKCCVCGLIDHSVVYDFHHTDPSQKEFAISRAIGNISWERTVAECEKCILLCAICHRKLHCGLVGLDEIKQLNRLNQIETKSKNSG